MKKSNHKKYIKIVNNNNSKTIVMRPFIIYAHYF